MPIDYPDLPRNATWSSTRVFYPAGRYQHAAARLLQVRVVRRGSSYAQIDLGTGPRRVYTRPGDILVSLPDRSTTFRIDEGRELTLLQLELRFALKLLRQAGASGLAELEPLLQKPVREPLVAELIRRLETGAVADTRHQQWALGLVLHGLLREARGLAARRDRRPFTRGNSTPCSRRSVHIPNAPGRSIALRQMQACLEGLSLRDSRRRSACRFIST